MSHHLPSSISDRTVGKHSVASKASVLTMIAFTNFISKGAAARFENPAVGCHNLLRHSKVAKPFTATRLVSVKASSTADSCPDPMDRRTVLLAASTAALALPGITYADGETKTLFGLASPPTSYGGYGGNAKEAAKYIYEYPSTWKQETVGKQEKGMVGIDSRVRNPRVKLETAFTITFGRAGEDNKRFKLGDVDTTLQGFAGADYDLQDCLVGATYKKNGKRIKDDQEFYDYELSSSDVTFLVSVSLKAGKVYALFVKAPAKVFKQDEAQLRNIVETFTIL